jgi:hypothetical protein
MKNQLEICHEYFQCPDDIIVDLNNIEIYSGAADIRQIDFDPAPGSNVLRVTLAKKYPGNFEYDPSLNSVTKNSKVRINNIIVENRHFRSLVIKCGLVEIDLAKNLSFPSKYIDHENCLTMEGSIYLIKFDFPVKNWMQIHLHGRNLESIRPANSHARELLNKIEK